MNDMTIGRRGVLGLFGASAAATLPTISRATETMTVRFDHGVASGDPSADGAVIWTRVTADGASDRDIEVRWTVRETTEGPDIASGSATARAAADHTVKVEVAGLQAGRDYRYHFEGPDRTASPEGRFRTLPVGAVRDVVLAVASCQLYPGGYFNAYADLARRERLDAVIHLGDYIYEYGDTGYGTDIGRKLGRLPDPPAEILTLRDYRRRHAQVKADPDMQAAHARAAFICVWDDHEVTNDGWLGGAENHQSDTEGDWAGRKAVAMQAYFEWMPIRDPDPLRAHEAIFRSFEFGDLATLAMLETRLLARAKQIEFTGEVGNSGDYAALAEEVADPARELIGPQQQAWLGDVLTRSVRAGKPWQIVGNQVVMGRVNGPDFERELGAEGYAALLAKLPGEWSGRLRDANTNFRGGVQFNLDSWDGYPAARERLYRTFRNSGSKPIVLAGDSHAAWANNLYDETRELVAIEVGCTAITSPSYGSLVPGIGTYIANASPEVAFCNQDAKGYSLLTLTSTAAIADYVSVSTVTDKTFTSKRGPSFTTSAGKGFGPWQLRT